MYAFLHLLFTAFTALVLNILLGNCSSGLFNDTFSTEIIWCWMVGLINGQEISEDMEESNHDQIEVLSQNFPGGTEENHKNP